MKNITNTSNNMKIKFGHLIEAFVITPNLSINWLTYCNKKYYEVQFAWLFWYVKIGKVEDIINDWR